MLKRFTLFVLSLAFAAGASAANPQVEQGYQPVLGAGRDGGSLRAR